MEMKNLMKSKIVLEAEDFETCKVEINGSKIALQNLLAHLIKILNEQSNLSKKDIKFAVELGLKDNCELKEMVQKKEENFKKLLDELLK